MRQFVAGRDDPAEFDIENLGYLRRRYLELLSEIRDEIEKRSGFQSRSLSRDIYYGEDWEIVARLLILGFAAAEALGVDPSSLMDLWVRYCQYRIFPIIAFNRSLDITREAMTADKRTKYVIKTGLNAFASQSTGFLDAKESNDGLIFWEVHSRYLSRISQIAYEEFSTRFDNNCLENPSILLKTYNTKLCPLLRSSTLEPLMVGIAKMYNIRLLSYAWIELYEKIRQLLDDIGDIWEDLTVGRLTYPVLIALRSAKEAIVLSRAIRELWQETSTLEKKTLDVKHWPKIKSSLKRSGALSNACDLVKAWHTEILSSLNREEFRGEIEPLLIIMQLKSAFLARLIEFDFDDHKPEFVFYPS